MWWNSEYCRTKPSCVLGKNTNSPGTAWWKTNVSVCLSPHNEDVQLDFEGGSVRLFDDGTWEIYGQVG